MRDEFNSRRRARGDPIPVLNTVREWTVPIPASPRACGRYRLWGESTKRRTGALMSLRLRAGRHETELIFFYDVHERVFSEHSGLSFGHLHAEALHGVAHRAKQAAPEHRREPFGCLINLLARYVLELNDVPILQRRTCAEGSPPNKVRRLPGSPVGQFSSRFLVSWLISLLF